MNMSKTNPAASIRAASITVVYGCDERGCGFTATDAAGRSKWIEQPFEASLGRDEYRNAAQALLDETNAEHKMYVESTNPLRKISRLATVEFRLADRDAPKIHGGYAFPTDCYML